MNRLKITPRSERCCTCGRPRGLAQRRENWSFHETGFIPHTPNPAEHGDQITNDVVIHAGVYRNGGTGSDTHFCDECLRVGLRIIKLEVCRLLELCETGLDKDAELAELTARLAHVQHYHQWLAYEHDRMQTRFGDLLRLVDTLGVPENDVLKFARFEVKRGPAKRQEDDYAFRAPSDDADLVKRCIAAIEQLDRETGRPLTAEDQARAVLSVFSLKG